MLRILIILPFYGGSLPIGRYCAEAFREAGCMVDTLEAPSFYGAFSALKSLQVSIDRLEFLENNFLQLMSQAILAKVESFQPDLVFCLAQAPMSRNTLKRLKKENITTAMWFVEDYRLFPYWRAYAPYYDIFAVIQKEPFLGELDTLGVSNALYLPLAALPSVHKPLSLTPEMQEEYGADLSFLGEGYPNRCNAFKRLKRDGFKIWGTGWEREPELAPYVQKEGQRISPEEAVIIYNASCINLNLHSSVQTDHLVSGGDFVNPRTFELAAANAFQLVDRRTLMPELFESDELVCFSSIEELDDQIVFYLSHPEARKASIQKAQATVLQKHQYIHRIQTFLEYAHATCPNLGKARPLPDAYSTLPETVQKELVSLMEQMFLPSTASFTDVTTALKQKTGVLSDVETALLFLDEWQKQYS